MPLPFIAWGLGALAVTLVTAGTAYVISQMDNDTPSSGHGRDAERRQREAQEEQIRQKIAAEADAWLRSQRIRLDHSTQARLMTSLIAGTDIDEQVRADLTRASPAIRHAADQVAVEAQCVAECAELLDLLRADRQSSV